MDGWMELKNQYSFSPLGGGNKKNGWAPLSPMTEDRAGELPGVYVSPKMADTCGQVLLGSGLTVLSHPLMYIKVLIQVRGDVFRQALGTCSGSGSCFTRAPHSVQTKVEHTERGPAKLRLKKGSLGKRTLSIT